MTKKGQLTFPSLQDLRADLPLPPLLIRLLRHLLGETLLLVTVVEDSGAVLGSGVHALAVEGGGIVHLVEELEEGVVADRGRVEGHLEGFGVCIITHRTKSEISPLLPTKICCSFLVFVVSGKMYKVRLPCIA